MGYISRAVNNIGTAVWFGGTLMGTLAMNPAVEVLDDPEERGKMVDEGWARYQPWGALGLMAALVTHVIIRRRPPRHPSNCYKNIARIKDLLMVAACVSSVASLALGEYATHQELYAYSPMDTATEPNEDTPPEAEQAQMGLSVASIVQLASGVGLFIAGAVMDSERD
jgi:hypothetical protein